MASAIKHEERAKDAVRESKHLDFKSQFDVAVEGDWCEIVKDIVAFANSGGGVILLGVANDGTKSNFDPAAVLALDPADMTNKMVRYTGLEFSDIEVIHVRRADGWFAAIKVEASRIPIPFTRPGTYKNNLGVEKSAFAKGTVYFRHGAKSEPADSHDFTAWRDREVARVRSEWLGGIRKVVTAPAGQTVTLVPASSGAAVKSIVHAEISQTGKGPMVAVANAEAVWPYRQKDLLAEINRLIAPTKVTSHDIQCANRKFDVLKSRSDLAYKPHRLTSPQYSRAYVDLLVRNAKDDPSLVRLLHPRRPAKLRR